MNSIILILAAVLVLVAAAVIVVVVVVAAAVVIAVVAMVIAVVEEISIRPGGRPEREKREGRHLGPAQAAQTPAQTFGTPHKGPNISKGSINIVYTGRLMSIHNPLRLKRPVRHLHQH